jgi:hypothetical protein
MYHLHYDLVRRMNEEVLRSAQVEHKQFSNQPIRSDARIRLQIWLSDALFDISERIRPEIRQPCGQEDNIGERSYA